MSSFKNGLKKVGNVWHYKFKYKGVQYHGSTGFTKWEDAHAYLLNRRDEVRKQQIKAGDVPTFGALWERYLRDNTLATEVSKQCTANSIVPWVLPIIGKVKVSEIGPQHFGQLKRHYLAHTKAPGRPHSEGGAAKMLTDVRTVINTTKKYPEFRGIQVVQVPVPKVQEKVVITIPLDRVEAFIQASNTHHAQTQPTLAIRIMLFMGLRISEIVTMRWEWFAPDYSTYTPGKTKGREADGLPVFEDLIPHIKAWREEATIQCARLGWSLPPIVFFKLRDAVSWKRDSAKDHRMEHWTPRDKTFCNARINRAARMLDLAGKWGPHKLRHSFATMLVEMGVSNKVVQELLRHKSPITTQRYIHVTSTMRTDAIRRLKLPRPAERFVHPDPEISAGPDNPTDSGGPAWDGSEQSASSDPTTDEDG